MVYDMILYVWIFLKLPLKRVKKCHFGTGLIIWRSVLGRFKKKKMQESAFMFKYQIKSCVGISKTLNNLGQKITVCVQYVRNYN